MGGYYHCVVRVCPFWQQVLVHLILATSMATPVCDNYLNLSLSLAHPKLPSFNVAVVLKKSSFSLYMGKLFGFHYFSLLLIPKYS